MLIIRRSNCINTAPGIVLSVSDRPLCRFCISDGHLQKVIPSCQIFRTRLYSYLISKHDFGMNSVNFSFFSLYYVLFHSLFVLSVPSMSFLQSVLNDPSVIVE